jgi:hypothetical protein
VPGRWNLRIARKADSARIPPKWAANHHLLAMGREAINRAGRLQLPGSNRCLRAINASF